LTFNPVPATQTSLLFLDVPQLAFSFRCDVFNLLTDTQATKTIFCPPRFSSLSRMSVFCYYPISLPVRHLLDPIPFSLLLLVISPWLLVFFFPHPIETLLSALLVRECCDTLDPLDGRGFFLAPSLPPPQESRPPKIPSLSLPTAVILVFIMSRLIFISFCFRLVASAGTRRRPFDNVGHFSCQEIALVLPTFYLPASSVLTQG